MKKTYKLVGVFLLFFIPSSAFAQSTEQMTITSYYPSPFGVYDRLRLMPRGAAPSCLDKNDWGSIYYDEAQGLLVCSDDGFNGGKWGSSESIWDRDKTNKYIFPKDLSDSLGIGTNTPLAPVHITAGLDKANFEAIRLENTGLAPSGASIDFYDLNGLGAKIAGGYTSGGGRLSFFTSGFDERMSITGTGNVGIGTTTAPVEKLEVNGNAILNRIGLGGAISSDPSVYLSAFSPAARTAIQLNNVTTLFLSAQGGGPYIGTEAADSLNLGTDNTVRLIIDGTTGHVGIGTLPETVDPNINLKVAAGSSFDASGFAGTPAITAQGDGTGIVGRGSGTGLNTDDAGVIGESSWIGVIGRGERYGVMGSAPTPLTSWDFFANGPGVDYGTSSSIRWKKDIKPIDHVLEKVLSLRGVYFNWDPQHGGHHDLGMIAEEVGKAFPEVVVFEEDGQYASGMDYGKLTTVLVEAIKEQQKQMDELKKDIEILKRNSK